MARSAPRHHPAFGLDAAATGERPARQPRVICARRGCPTHRLRLSGQRGVRLNHHRPRRLPGTRIGVGFGRARRPDRRGQPQPRPRVARRRATA